jgi:hypothetical protein
MLELTDIQSSPEELENYYAQLATEHVTPAWIGGGISIEPQTNAVPYLWHWRDLRPQAMRAAELVGNKLYLGATREAAEWFRRADAVAPRDPERWTWLQSLGRALMLFSFDIAAVAPSSVVAAGVNFTTAPPTRQRSCP